MDVIPLVWGTGRGGRGAEVLPSTGNVEAHWEDTTHSWDIMVVGVP